MASNSSDSTPARSGGWLDRLKAMAASFAAPAPLPGEATPPQQPGPTWELPARTAPPDPESPAAETLEAAGPVNEDAIPLALPVEDTPAGAVPLAIPVREMRTPPAASIPDMESVGFDDGARLDAADATEADEELVEAAPPCTGNGESPTAVMLEVAAAPLVCPVCQSVQSEGESCSECGYYFSAADRAGL